MKTTLLRWSLSLTLGAPAMALAATSRHVPLVAIGAVEAAGAFLLLLPRTRLAGAVLLLLSLVAASTFHVLSGESAPPAVLVYAAAIVVVTEPC
jgi:hypothetical protein